MLLGHTAAAAALLVCLPLPPPRGAWPVALPAGAVLAVLLFRLLAGRWPRPGWRAGTGRLVVAAAGEEVIWRWLVLGAIRGAAGAAVAVLASSAGFALAHARLGRTSVAANALTGAAFGTLYAASGSLVAAIAAHALYNAFVAAAAGSPAPA